MFILFEIIVQSIMCYVHLKTQRFKTGKSKNPTVKSYYTIITVYKTIMILKDKVHMNKVHDKGSVDLLLSFHFFFLSLRHY